MARSSRRRNTPASSPVEIPTSKSGWLGRSSRARTSARSAGPSLPAQPAALQRAVSRVSSARDGLLSLVLDMGAIFADCALQVSPRISGGSVAAEAADVADSGGDAGVIEMVEEGDGEFAGGAEQITVDRRGDFRVFFQVLQEAGARRIKGGASVIKVAGDFDDPAFSFHRAEYGPELR